MTMVKPYLVSFESSVKPYLLIASFSIPMFISDCLCAVVVWYFKLWTLILFAATIFAYGQRRSGKTYTMRGIITFIWKFTLKYEQYIDRLLTSGTGQSALLLCNVVGISWE